MIGWTLGIAASTVHAVLRRHGRSRLVVRKPRPRRWSATSARARRARPRQHQEARADSATGPPRHRRSPRPGQGQGRLAAPVRRNRRPLDGSASPPSTRTRPRQRDLLPGRTRSLLRLRTRSRWNACSTDNGAALSDAGTKLGPLTRSPCARRAPTAHRPTARPSASSAPCSSAGHTRTPTRTSQSVLPRSPRHSTSTIASVATALW